jgi:CNT family concentrative nucleoside transporter
VLYYLGLLQKIVFGFAWIMQRTMKLSGAESFAAAANVFVGQTEAPLMVKPYLKEMTRSEVLCLMTGGMATIAGGVLVAYISILGGENPERQVTIGKHLLTASILSAPAAILCAKLLLPETEAIDQDLKVSRESIGCNLFDAITAGTTQGLKLALNVGAILLLFIAMIAMINYITINWIGSWTGLNAIIVEFTDGRFEGLNLQFIFGVLFAPVAWIIGIESGNLLLIGQLLGEKIVLNEFIAFISLDKMVDGEVLTNERTIMITTYALCGFANFGSMGIQIGGIAVLAPNQRSNLATLALRAMIGGMVACLMTACVAGMFIH